MDVQLDIALDRRRRDPIFLQLARGIAAEIARGRLSHGTALPSTRTLATELGVHRNTVVAAYAELVSEGWATARQGDATRVANDVPKAVRVRASRTERPARAAYPLVARASIEQSTPRARYEMLGGLPELRGLDLTALARSYKRALEARKHATLRYAGPEGDARLRAALAQFLRNDRGLAVDADDVMVTRGSQMALALSAQVLIEKGDVVAVETPGYPHAWSAFRERGAVLAPIPVDAHGLDIDALKALCARTKVRAVYVTPHHQYPTTVTLSPSRRLALLALARAERFAIIEDDYDHEFHYEGRPVLPLASRDTEGSVIYVGTLAKILAPSLRIGFVVAPRPVLASFCAVRASLDRQGDTVVERAVAELIEDGFVDRHVRRARRMYRERRDVLAEALTRSLGKSVEFCVPQGGLSLWVNVAPEIDAERWQQRALEREVLVLAGRRFSLGSPPNALRIGYGALDVSELAAAVSLLSAARPRAGSSERRAKKAT